MEKRLAAKTLDGATLSACLDETSLQCLSIVLDSYTTTPSSAYTPSISMAKFTNSAIKVSNYTFLAKDVLEKRIIEPFLELNAEFVDSWTEEEFMQRLLRFYYSERLSTISLISFLLSSSAGPISAEVIAHCRDAIKTMYGKGVLEAMVKQLINLQQIDVPTPILKENRSDLAYMWISQNIREQRELSGLLFNILQAEWLQIESAKKVAILHDLMKGNFGLNQLGKYNIDEETLALVQESTWLRLLAAISVFDFKSMLDCSVSPSQILNRLNPIRVSDLLKMQTAFVRECNHPISALFKLAWAIYVGFLDLLDILDSDQLRFEYSKIATSAIEQNVFGSLIECLSGSMRQPSAFGTMQSVIKSCFKSQLLAFFTVFDLDRSTLHIQTLNECLSQIFTGETLLCEEFWYTDAQYPSRVSLLKHLLSRFPYDFIPLLRLLQSLSAGKNCSRFIFDLFSKGIDGIFVERLSDRGQISEEYDLSNEVYHLNVINRSEIFSCGVGMVLEPGTTGVMSSGFNERPMAQWNISVSGFQFIVRVLSISQDFEINSHILNFFEAYLSSDSSNIELLMNHLSVAAPIFTESRSPSLAMVLLDSLIFALDQQSPNALIMSKILSCFVCLQNHLDSDFINQFLLTGTEVIDKVVGVLRSESHQSDLNELNIEVFLSVIKFTEMLCNARTSSQYGEAIKSMKRLVFDYAAENVGRWQFENPELRVKLVAELCRSALNLQSVIGVFEPAFRSASLFSTIFRLLAELNNGTLHHQNLMSRARTKPIDYGLLIIFLMHAISSVTETKDIIILAEFFSVTRICLTDDGESTSPFDILISCLDIEPLILPVLLFFQYAFEHSVFSISIRLERSSSSTLAKYIDSWLNEKSSDSNHMHRVRLASLPILNNCACTRPDIFASIFEACKESFIFRLMKSLEAKCIDNEVLLYCSILSVLWSTSEDFATAISSLRQKPALLSKLCLLLKAEFPEHDASLAMKTFASIFEILAVEFGHFKQQSSFSNDFSVLKEIDLDRLVRKLSLFKDKEMEPFSAFLDSFTTFSQVLVCSSNSSDLVIKVQKVLIALILEVYKADNYRLTELIAKALNYSILNDQSGLIRIVGFDKFTELLEASLMYIKKSLSTTDEFRAENLLVHLLMLTSNLLAGGSSSQPLELTNAQIGILHGTLEAALDALRRSLQSLNAHFAEKSSSLCAFFITGLAVFSASPHMAHMLRREAALKTIFSYIVQYKDSASMAILLSVAVRINPIIEELVHSDTLEALMDSEAAATITTNDGLFVHVINLLRLVKLQFPSTPSVNERLSAILFAFNIGGRLCVESKAQSQPHAERSIALHSLIKLLAIGAENPVHCPASDAFLAYLVPFLLDALMSLMTEFSAVDYSTAVSVSSSDIMDAVISTLGLLNAVAKPNFQLRKAFVANLYPIVDHESFGSSYSAGIFSFLACLSKLKARVNLFALRQDITQSLLQLLLINCPDSMLPKLKPSLQEYNNLF